MDLENALTSTDNAFIYLNWLKELSISYSLKLLGSLLILAFVYVFSLLCVRILSATLSKLHIEITLNNFLCRLLKMIFFCLGLLAALKNLGVDTTSFVAFFTACSFAISFAFKETLSNIAAGVLIIIFRPFVIGDLVKLASGEGRIKDISMFSVTLLTNENTCQIIPNGKIINDIILNYSREKQRKIALIRQIEPAKLCEISEKIKNAFKDDEFCQKDKGIEIKVINLGANDLSIEISMWVKSEIYHNAQANMNTKLAKILL